MSSVGVIDHKMVVPPHACWIVDGGNNTIDIVGE